VQVGEEVVAAFSVCGSTAPFLLVRARQRGTGDDAVLTPFAIPSERVVFDFRRSVLYARELSKDELAAWSLKRVIAPCVISDGSITFRPFRSTASDVASPARTLACAGMTLVRLGDLSATDILRALDSGGATLLDCVASLRKALMEQTPITLKDKTGHTAVGSLAVAQ
jgi:hypothetical protein